MRALLLACRALADVRTHSSSRASVFCRAEAFFSSTSRRRLLLLEPRRVVAFAGNAAAVVEFQNPLGRVVEEVAIVRHGDDRACVLVEMPLQPGDALGIEMVRRFVEQQQVGLFQQELAQRDAALFAAGECRHVGIARRQVHRLHGDFDLAIEFPGVAVVDLVLHFGLAVEQLFHLVGIGHFAELFGKLLELGEQCPRRGDGFFDVAEYVFVRIELAALASAGRR